jgi:hypothetical protein
MGLVRPHTYKTTKNISGLSLNNVSMIKPNDIKFKNINVNSITNKNIKKRFERLRGLKSMGLGHRIPKKTLNHMNRENRISRSLNPIYENSSHSNQSQQTKRLQKRLNNLHGPISIENLQKRLNALNGPPATLEQLQKRLDALRGIPSKIMTLEQFDKRLKKLENN